jgi:hypothetical protein
VVRWHGVLLPLPQLLLLLHDLRCIDRVCLLVVLPVLLLLLLADAWHVACCCSWVVSIAVCAKICRDIRQGTGQRRVADSFIIL